jgi:hypothetical protein
MFIYITPFHTQVALDEKRPTRTLSLPLSYVVSQQSSSMAQDDVSVAGISAVVLYLPRLAMRCIFLDTYVR